MEFSSRHPLPSPTLARSLQLAYAVGVSERISQSMAMLLIPLWAINLHSPPIVLGIDVAAPSLAPMVLAIPIGALADRLGAGRIVLWGSLVAAVATLFTAWVASPWTLALWQVFAGLGRSAAWIGAQALVTRPGQPKGGAGWLSLSAQIGNLSGPVAAGALLTPFGIPLAFLCSSAGLWLVAGASLLIRLPEARLSHREKGSPLGDFRAAAHLMRHSGMRLVTVTTVVRLALIALRASFYIVFLHHHRFAPLSIGILLGLAAGMSALFAVGAERLAQRLSYRTLLLLGLSLMGASIALTPADPHLAWQLAMMTLFGAGTGVSQPALIVLLAESVPSQARGLAFGWRTAVNRLAQVASPMVLGALAGFFALPVLLTGFGLLSVLTLLGVGLMVRLDGRPTTRED